MTPGAIKALVRTVPDFPASGIQFRDITTLIGHGEGFAAAIDWLAERAREAGAEAIAGLEARGFVFGAPVAAQLALPFIAIRKPGKLPVDTIGVDYALEYGTDRLEMDPGSVGTGQRVVLIDDLVATGGTAGAGIELLRRAGAVAEAAIFAIDLPDLGGAARLRQMGVDVFSLMDFPGD